MEIFLVVTSPNNAALWAFAIPIEVVSCTSGGSNINRRVRHFLISNRLNI